MNYEAVATACNDAPVSFWRQVTTLLWKDLRVELRSREILATMTFFAAMVVLLFSFAFIKGDEVVADVAPGILWVSIAFAGTLGLSRGFDRERESDTMRGLLLAPASRTAIFLGKALAILFYMMLVEIVVVPLVAFLFEVPLFDYPLALVATLVAGSFGFAAVGTVFAAMLLRSRSRDVLLPVVLYPILVPLLIACTRSTASLLEGDLESVWYLLQFIGLFDGVFVVVSLWVFESLVIE
ncbi:MAG TPA: heme exporter protein CcmB [Kofleriaceae bacterium]|nr:heme exporter protein CcmB [Kofleriaceae bacterium]